MAQTGRCGQASCICVEKDFHHVGPKLPDGFFLCVARVGGVLRSGWAVPGTKELLTMSAVKPRLAALCMFGGLDSTSPDDLNRAFLKHRENVTSFLMQSQMLRNSQDLSCVAGYCADGGCAGGSFRENDPSRPHDDLSMPQRHASTQVQLASEHYSHSVHHMLGDAAERRRASDAAAANPAKRAPLQLSAPETTGRHATLPARVDILLAHRCGHKACVCETECLAVHEVEPRLPCRWCLVVERRSQSSGSYCHGKSSQGDWILRWKFDEWQDLLPESSIGEDANGMSAGRCSSSGDAICERSEEEELQDSASSPKQAGQRASLLATLDQALFARHKRNVKAYLEKRAVGKHSQDSWYGPACQQAAASGTAHGAHDAAFASRHNLLSSKSAADSSASTPLAAAHYAARQAVSSVSTPPFLNSVVSTPNSGHISGQTAPSVGEAGGVSEDDRVQEANQRAARLQTELNTALAENGEMANELKVALGSESLLRSRMLEESSRRAALERDRICAKQHSAPVTAHTWEAVWGIERLILELKRIVERDDGCALVALVDRTGCSLDELHPQLHGLSLLHYACEKDKVQCCRELLKANADPNNLSMPDIGDEMHLCQTPLHSAVSNASQRCLEVLLADSRVHVDAADSEGRTPLHLAAASSDEKAIESLLASNGDPLVKDKHGKTSLQYAHDKMQSEAEATIQDRGAPGEARVPRAHKGFVGSGQALAANARAGRGKMSAGVKRKSGYIHCKKCGNHHHWHSKCAQVSQANGAQAKKVCSSFRRPSSSAADIRLSHGALPYNSAVSCTHSSFDRDGKYVNGSGGGQGLREVHGGRDATASKMIFRKKRKQKPLNQRHTKQKTLGRKLDHFDAEPYGSAEEADAFGDLDGSDDYDRYDTAEIGDEDGRWCGQKRLSTSGPRKAGEELARQARMSCGQQDDQGISSASIRRMAQLEEFKARHGHTWVSTDQHSKFYVKGLGGWVLAQRKARRRGEMSAHLEDALDDLGFSWTGPPRNSLRKSKGFLDSGGADVYGGGWREYESEPEGDAEGDWHADDDGLDEREGSEPGGGLWSCGTDAHGNHANSYDETRVSPLGEEEDADMNHLSQLQLSSMHQQQSAMTLADLADTTTTSPNTVDSADTPTDHILLDVGDGDAFGRGLDMALESSGGEAWAAASDVGVGVVGLGAAASRGVSPCLSVVGGLGL